MIASSNFIAQLKENKSCLRVGKQWLTFKSFSTFMAWPTQKYELESGTHCNQGFFQGFFRAVKRPQKLNLELSLETQSSHQSFSAVKMKLFELN
jgi:hypothetical protein